MDLKKELQRLARNHCATFNTGTKENCLLETGADTTCNYFRAGDNRCWYFETHVLPAFPEVEEIYMRQVAGVDTDVNYGECAYCGKEFVKTSNAVKYCSDKCRAEGLRKSKRKYNTTYYRRMIKEKTN